MYLMHYFDVLCALYNDLDVYFDALLCAIHSCALHTVF